MNYLALDPNLVEMAVRSVKAVAMADGVLADLERRLLRSALHVMHVDIDIDAVSAATPEECAAAVSDPTWRLRIVQAQIVMALIDGEIVASETDVIARFATALDVDEPRLKNIRQVVGGHILLMKLDLNRRSQMIDDVLKEAWAREGLKGLWMVSGSMLGLSRSDALAEKYRALGDLPEDTFGRAYFEHMKELGFALPGEVKGFPELLVKHDLAHVIGDYDTTPLGECEVVSFICGFLQADPFWYLMMIALQMHLGIKTFSDDSPPDHLQFQPEAVVAAMARGAEVNRDLYEVDWDFFADFPLRLEEVRAKYNVLPKERFAIPAAN